MTPPNMAGKLVTLQADSRPGPTHSDRPGGVGRECTSFAYADAVTYLDGIFGEPTYHAGALRWLLKRASGIEVRIELHAASRELWVFDPEGRGLRGAYAMELDSPGGLAMVRADIRRLLKG